MFLRAYLQRVPSRALLAAAVFLGVSGTQSDPATDFGFSFASDETGLFEELPPAYHAMSEEKVARILSDHLDRQFNEEETLKLSRHLIQTCQEYRFDPALILSLIMVESSFRTAVVSPAGAIGLMQLMPGTAAYVARKEGIPYRGPRSLKDPATNITLGVAYLSYLRNRYRGLSQYFQFAAYNMGPGRLDHLRSRKNFRPRETKVYYQKIKEGVLNWRYYGERQTAAAEPSPASSKPGV